MRINDYEYLYRKMIDKNINDTKEYLSLLKVMGNNSKYDFSSQVSIAHYNKEATACAEYDFWQEAFNRTVKRGQKGIPTLRQFNDCQKIVYIFDVSQTVSKNKNVNEINLWKINNELKNDTLNRILKRNI
ncbi:hypothetical protein [Mycoplasmopsis californica]|uniref:hypothetical protein n=1 Tax=Mycoplasmopsis californica TaxID=2113 RepID=UPI00056FE6FB|nr:hypothetical protein [Mycoplasmopsis californica]